MKKIIAIAMAVLCMVPAAKAIDFTYGVQAGLNLTRLNTNSKDGMMGLFNSNNRAGFFVGPKIYLGIAMGLSVNLAAEYNLSKYSITTETPGMSEDGEILTYTGTESKNQSSFEIPLNLRYSFGVGKISIFAETGPQFGFNIGSKKVGEFFKNENMVNSWNLGIGVRVRKFEIGASYNFGMNKVGKTILEGINENLVSKADLPSYKRNTFQAHLTYYFK